MFTFILYMRSTLDRCEYMRVITIEIIIIIIINLILDFITRLGPR
jgi:hypothetical protein